MRAEPPSLQRRCAASAFKEARGGLKTSRSNKRARATFGGPSGTSFVTGPPGSLTILRAFRTPHAKRRGNADEPRSLLGRSTSSDKFIAEARTLHAEKNPRR